MEKDDVMAWIQLHQELFNHRKTRKAAKLLGIPKVYVVGHITALWCWCLDNAPDGDLSHIDQDIIADISEYPGDALLYCNTLQDAGFIDNEGDCLFIHDWDEYAGRLIERRKSDTERKRKDRDIRRTSAGHPQDMTRMSCARVEKSRVDKTKVEKSTLDAIAAPNPEPESILGIDYFTEAFTAYKSIHTPKGSQTECRKAWHSILKLPKADKPSEPDLLQAVKNYIAQCWANDSYTKRMNFFLSPSSRPYEEYLPANYHPAQQAEKPLPVNITPTGGTNNVSRFAARVRRQGTE